MLIDLLERARSVENYFTQKRNAWSVDYLLIDLLVLLVI
jgi:hypothetical protein